jgi:hypothetical protein
MTLVCIDPGPEVSGFCVLDGTTLVEASVGHNEEIRRALRLEWRQRADPVLVLEQVAHMGMAVGKDVFDAVYWSGRFHEAWVGFDAGRFRPVVGLTRHEVKVALCGTVRATDANIRQALVDRYGGSQAAVGRKRAPGPLFGVRSHAWAALALGITYLQRLEVPPE